MLEAIGAWPGASWLQQSATAYLFVNAAHILGVAVLLGAILPLDLRLLGLFRQFPIEVLRAISRALRRRGFGPRPADRGLAVLRQARRISREPGISLETRVADVRAGQCRVPASEHSGGFHAQVVGGARDGQGSRSACGYPRSSPEGGSGSCDGGLAAQLHERDLVATVRRSELLVAGPSALTETQARNNPLIRCVTRRCGGGKLVAEDDAVTSDPRPAAIH